VHFFVEGISDFHHPKKKSACKNQFAVFSRVAQRLMKKKKKKYKNVASGVNNVSQTNFQ
jgi:hypothetical protein